MRIVAYRTTEQNGKVLLEESTGEVCHSNDIAELFAFLLEDYGDCIKICWNLDQTVALLLRLMGTAACRQLRKEKKAYMAPFQVFYVSEKVFGVSHIPSRQRSQLYGLEQYFPELPEPDRVEETQILGEKLLKELKKMGLQPTKLTSPIAIYEECVLSKLNLPKLKDMPMEAAEMAWRCSGRLWIESHQLGYFDQVWDYDLVSAFPRIMQTMVDIRDLKCVQAAEYQADALYGYALCDVEIYDWVMVHPIVTAIPEGLISHVGVKPDYYTKGQLDFINRHKIGEYRITDGWWMKKAARVPRTPLQAPLESLLKYKQGSEIQKVIAKRASTGVYGKMGEEREEEFGPYFNPAWFAEVSTGATLEVGEFLYRHGIGPGDNEGYRSLLHIGVDGVMLSRPIEEIG